MTVQYDIAVLLPTRGRTDSLMRSVKSLFDLADNKDRIQLMLGIDNDDKAGIKHFTEVLKPWLDDNKIAYTALSFAPLGYGQLDGYVNKLAQKAVPSNWYFFWNDDAVMETQGWDQVISSYTGQFKLLAVHTHNDHPYSIFPIVPKPWLDTLGYLSQHQMNDAWCSQIAYQLDIWERIEVHVIHDRSDLTGNNTDETYANRVLFEGNPSNPKDFHNFGVIQKRINDSNKLADYMKSVGLSTTWWENCKLGTQDPWVKLKQNDVNGQMQQFKLNKDGKMIPQSKELYDFNYFESADGIQSWKSASLKFGDALAGLGYAFGIPWETLTKEFPKVFEVDPNGRAESTGPKLVNMQIDYLKKNATRTPKKVLEIGGGRGEVANTLKYMGVEVVSVEMGTDAEQWYIRTGEHYFGKDFDPVLPVVKRIGDVINDIDLSEFDTILMVESLEHIPEQEFDSTWKAISEKFHGMFVVVNWPDYHPIWVGRDASPEEHCRLVDDELYDKWSAQAKNCVFRKGSHLVLEF